jgi:hypothetical protein
MKSKTKQIENLPTNLNFLPPPQRWKETAPNKLEIFEQTANTRTIVTAADCARWTKPFDRNITAKGIAFKTEIGSFKLAVQGLHAGRIVFTLENLQDKTRLTARLLTDPHTLFDFRNRQNFMAVHYGTYPKINRTSPRVPCLIIEWKEADCERTDLNREILPQIFTAAAFGHLKYWWRTARRVQKIILHSPPAGPRPSLNFSTGKTAPAAPGSAQ